MGQQPANELICHKLTLERFQKYISHAKVVLYISLDDTDPAKKTDTLRSLGDLLCLMETELDFGFRFVDRQIEMLFDFPTHTATRQENAVRQE